MKQLEEILDARHAVARKAFFDREINAYAKLFATRLEYVQANGKTIDHASLMRDVATQFKIADRFDSRYTVEALLADRSCVTETTFQTALIKVRAFGILRRIYRIERRGNSTWAQEGGDWKIIATVIFMQTFGPNGRLACLYLMSSGHEKAAPRYRGDSDAASGYAL